MPERYNRVLVNALPKSGTHLLIHTLAGCFGYADYFSEPPRNREIPSFMAIQQIKKVLGNEGLARNTVDSGPKVVMGFFEPFALAVSILQAWLEAIPGGFQFSGHFPHDSVLCDLFHALGYKHIGILRDPRAVAVSRLRFILEPGTQMRKIFGGRHFLEADLKAMSASQRLALMLEGGYAPQAGVTLGSFADAYHRMLAWRNDPNCLMIRFEDLIGEQGGGSRQAQMEVIEKIAGHLEIPLTETILRNADTIYDSSARTFKSGQIDSWRQRLEEPELTQLAAYCEPLCRAAGYTSARIPL